MNIDHQMTSKLTIYNIKHLILVTNSLFFFPKFIFRKYIIRPNFAALKQYTGKSLSEALILGSTNPQYDKRLFIDLPVQYM